MVSRTAQFPEAAGQPLICEKKGIHDNYLHSIDLLENDDKRELLKTYPASLEQGSLVAAMAAALRLFETLMNG